MYIDSNIHENYYLNVNVKMVKQVKQQGNFGLFQNFCKAQPQVKSSCESTARFFMSIDGYRKTHWEWQPTRPLFIKMHQDWLNVWSEKLLLCLHSLFVTFCPGVQDNQYHILYDYTIYYVAIGFLLFMFTLLIFWNISYFSNC